VTGLVVPPANEEALAEAILEMLGNSNRRFAMGEAALRRAHQEFSQEAMCARLADVYRSTLSGGSNHGGSRV
jgi:glycosyltransferase involved in cell wall biosynthesis